MTPESMAALHARAMTVPRPWTATEIRGLLDTAGVFAVGDDAGFALGRVVLDEAELLTIAVDPERRRQGLGRRWLAAFEAEARSRGAALSHLEVAAGNATALGLYESAGYERAGRRKGYYAAPDGTRDDAILLRKPLAGA